MGRHQDRRRPDQHPLTPNKNPDPEKERALAAGARSFSGQIYSDEMRRQGPLTLRHVVVAVLVVLVVNAQLTWWIIFVLRENRHRLELERRHLQNSAELAAVRVTAAAAAARDALETALAGGADPSSNLPPSPYFASWQGPIEGPCVPGWSAAQDGPVLTALAAGGCVTARPAELWLEQLRRLPAGQEIVAEAAPREAGIPVVGLPWPFRGQAVRPAAAAWNAVLETYRTRITMIVSEGSFFAVLLFVMLGLLWKTLRRESELERQHRNFLSAITHELKSPLAAMRLSLETVLRGRADSTASVRFLENALQDTERLQSLVQKVLEVTRYGRGDGGLTLRHGCVSDVLRDTIANFSRRATAAGARVDARIEPEVWAEIDEEALSIAISNLLENAIKYGGTVPRIEIRLVTRDGKALLDVGDNGRGIAEDDVPFVFNRFFRGGDEMTRTTQGTGLGLYLVRQIVTAHRGTVEVQRTGASGTTFQIMLPGAMVAEGAS